jgi:hypothetical protein
MLGGRSEQLKEISTLLTSTELRPALRRWFERFHGVDDRLLDVFRQHFGRLTGETFL